MQHDRAVNDQKFTALLAVTCMADGPSGFDACEGRRTEASKDMAFLADYGLKGSVVSSLSGARGGAENENDCSAIEAY